MCEDVKRIFSSLRGNLLEIALLITFARNDAVAVKHIFWCCLKEGWGVELEKQNGLERDYTPKGLIPNAFLPP